MLYKVKLMIINTETELTWKEIILSYVISIYLITYKTKIFLK